jgi:hypothetical protein
MIRAVVHLLADQPIAVDLLEPPKPGDVSLICTNVRTVDGRRPVFVDSSDSRFVIPYATIRFVEIQPDATDGRPPGAAAPGAGEPGEPAELDVDEDFLRRVREA